MKIGVTGPKGRVGSYLVKRYGATPIVANITDPLEVAHALGEANVDVLINCAAYTSVDGAEGNYEEAIRINTGGVGILRAVFEKYMIHLSTSYVFDGKQSIPYSEMSQENPAGSYGWSKYGGEAIMLGHHEEQNSCVVRTVSLYSPLGSAPDLVRNIIEGHAPIARNPAYKTSPTYVPHLAEALVSLALIQAPGIINIAGRTPINMYKFARLALHVLSGKKAMKRVFKGKKVSNYRPFNSSLNLRKAKRLRLPLYSVRQGLIEMKEEMNG